MDKREKVLAGLKACSVGIECGPGCPYEEMSFREEGCIAAMARDALEAIEALEPHVMTLEEVEDALDTVVWLDFPGAENYADEYGLIMAYSHKEAFAVFYMPFGDVQVYPRLEYEEYGKTWRCWNLRPKNRQREAVKWDG